MLAPFGLGFGNTANELNPVLDLRHQFIHDPFRFRECADGSGQPALLALGDGIGRRRGPTRAHASPKTPMCFTESRSARTRIRRMSRLRSR